MQIVKESFESKMLLKRIKYQIIFPQNRIYRKGESNFPALYLLHGLFGEAANWTELTEISTSIKKSSFAAVMFDAGNSWYADGIKGEHCRYESFFINEFIQHIENEYKIGGGRAKRAIAGLSMGGYGAIKFALKYPELFIWAGSMSGAFDAPHQTDKGHGSDWEILGDSIKEVFGRVGDNNSRIKNDLFRIISDMKNDEIKALPEIYFDCGRDDSFIQVNQNLFESFKEKNVPCSFSKEPGGHDWEYWNRQLKKILLLIERVFSRD